ncbi:triose-phosphate isomerase [Marinimicrobium agarilyticum]|uniref:triose-phosphate isomerase n=1 Tax=Marinimicrobium agarilyticum TaxID=306546 RepID=UPI000420862A|nr:triose-phosphate isomerase [Marinimicrobium agarilyticum]
MQTSSKTPLILGNWKMNGSLADNLGWVTRARHQLEKQPVHHVTLGVCPPFPYLQSLRQILPAQIALGAQDVSSECVGAYTGETSAAMLKELQCRYVLVGHSERRARLAETDGDVARKFRLAKHAGLTPVLCVGESQTERDNNETTQVITQQLQAVFELCGPEGFHAGVIAYEPIWAIGTGRTASPSDIEAVHGAIFEWLGKHQIPEASVHVLYGGSVKAENSADIFALEGVDGGLIGGASLNAGSFIDIARSANQTAQLAEPLAFARKSL